MSKNLVSGLRIVCLVLAGLLLLQLERSVATKNPLAGLAVPALLLADTAEGSAGSSTNSGTATNLPAPIQGSINRIAASEIFGPVPRPPVIQAALLGIAGRDAFLRAPDGQTGLLREGEEFGGIKLIRIGTNRVVIEQDGRQKELTMFSGFGSEPLLPRGKEKPQ